VRSKSARLAEELLSLVMDAERAESIAGDLAEESDREGTLWYWRSLLGVAAAMFFKTFGAARWRTLVFLASGFVLWFALYASIRLAGALLGIEPLIATVADGGAFAWGTQLYLCAALILASFGAGLALGPWGVAEGVNAAAPLAMFFGAAAVVLPVLDAVGGAGSWSCTALYVGGVPLLYVLPLLAGGALSRRRSPKVTPAGRV
jgi:hypothetical protein